MKVKLFFCFMLSLIGVKFSLQAQVSYNKQAMGAIGSTPKASDFSSAATLDDVDMATGTLKIGIPLYEIKVNDIVVPISIHYNAVGLKVGQEAGPVGMGWELRAGGKIVTNVIGRPDIPNGDFNDNKWSDETFNNPGSFDTWYNLGNAEIVQNVVDGTGDAAWDTYSYTLPQSSGMFTKNGMTYPYDPFLKVELHKYKIQSTNGLVYKFTSGEKKQRKKRTYYQRPSFDTDYIGDADFWADPQTAEWYDFDLKAIVSTRFNDSVTFEYGVISQNDPKLAAKTRIVTSESIPFNRHVIPENSDGGGIIDPNKKVYEIGSPVLSQNKTEVLSHTRLERIKFPNGEVSFDYRENDVLSRDVLLKITVYQITNGVTTVLKQFVFDYDWQQTNYGHYLTKLHQLDAKGANMGSWHFSYLDKLRVPPNTNSMAQDRWGFYNGKTSNKTLLEHPDKALSLRTSRHYPIGKDVNTIYEKSIFYRQDRQELMEFYGINSSGNIEDNVTIHRIDFANRDFDPNYAYKGMLSGLKTPTGSSYSYAYEPHWFRFSDFQPDGSSYFRIEQGGGYRVMSITKSLDHSSMYQYDTGESTITTQKYTYGEASYSESESALETNGIGTVSIPGTAIGTVASYYDTDLSITSFANIQLLSHPLNDMNIRSGSYGIYKSVTETIENSPVYTTFGKTVYYNNVPEYNDLYDAHWRTLTTDPEQYTRPTSYINAGVKHEVFTEPKAIKKYRFSIYGGEVVEERLFDYRSITAPKDAFPKLLSGYFSVAGQISGALPPYASPTALSDRALSNATHLFYSSLKSIGGSPLDYISASKYIRESSTLVYPGKYLTVFKDMAEYANCIRLVSETVKTFSQGIQAKEQTTYYTYDNPMHMLATKVATTSSRGDSTFVRKKYADDYPAGQGIVDYMKDTRQGLNMPVEEFTTYKPSANANTEYIKDGKLNIYSTENNAVVLFKAYKVKLPSDHKEFIWEWYNGANIDPAAWDEQSSWELYTKGNVHKYAENKGPSNVVIWGYRGQYPVAKVSNANNISSVNNSGEKFTSADVAYTSFEHTDSCNWSFLGTPVIDRSSPSGKLVYNLVSGNITKINATPEGKYIISYWYKDGATINVTGGTVSPAVIKNKWGSWRLAEHVISDVTAQIIISGTGLIDEVRFHPDDSQMTTYIYEPLIGLSGVIDAKGQTTYYEYDDFQRLKNVRDQRGNILKSHQYILGTSSYTSY